LSVKKPIKLAILWHLHQPNYQEPNSDKMVMPWVRLHATKDYLDMPLLATRYEKIKTTFNLVPSLLDQLDLYLNGGTDPHLELSRLNPENISESQKIAILETFFSANPTTMIEPYPRYKDIYRKSKNGKNKILPALFSSQEIRDLQVWSNLCWIDPVFHNEEPVKKLLYKERHFTEEDKYNLLEWQIKIIGKIEKTFRDLYQLGKIDISFTPYYHPILPLLCNTDIAKEAMPNITLPDQKFIHPEDARTQIEMSIAKFEKMFGSKLVGMWPSEGSISEEVAELLLDSGIKWIATDEEILFNSLKKGEQPINRNSLQRVYEYGSGLKLFFRDHVLSDKIGFVYSGWDADRAVNDFIENIKRVRSNNIDNLDNAVLSVILDGENCWEYFPSDGQDFLDALYSKLNDDDEIETVTMTEASQICQPEKLKSIFAGSWINHNFKIWIGHQEDNLAWDLLKSTRDKLVEFQNQNTDYDKSKLEKAWHQIYIAEGSDWCWWYGDEHRGDHNSEFDQIFRKHLIAVYKLLNLDIPSELLSPINQSESTYETQYPDSFITPSIDGAITHFYEWAGAGIFDTKKVGSSMHRVDRYANAIYFGFDKMNFYIRLDFIDKKELGYLKEPKLKISFYTDGSNEHNIELYLNKLGVENDDFNFAFDEIIELAVKRSFILENGRGEFSFNMILTDGDNKLEKMPSTKPIKVVLPGLNQELFWPL